MREPEPMDAATLRRRVPSWPALTVVEETGSTNADLAGQARSGAPDRTVLVAGSQTMGRGRLERSWSSPPGGSVSLSVLLRPDRPAASWAWLPLLSGLAVAEGLRTLTALDAGLKWPNDVIVGDRKLCGILAERVDTTAGPACVLGFGVNVRLAAADLPVPTATSLAVLLGERCPSRTDVVVAVLSALDLLLGRWAAGADAALRVAYLARSVTVGRRVRVTLDAGRSVEGLATDVEEGGRLVVQTDQGRAVFSAGDVVHLRAGETPAE